MSSVYNSIVKENITPNSPYDFTSQVWEDVKEYTSAIFTIQQTVLKLGKLTVLWGSGDQAPGLADADVIAQDSFSHDYTVSDVATRQFDVRARWVRIKYNVVAGNNLAGYVSISTIFKRAATEIKLVDETGHIVRVQQATHGNSLYTVLTDNCGSALKSTSLTGSAPGEALYTHLADASGLSLLTTRNTLLQRSTQTPQIRFLDQTSNLASMNISENTFTIPDTSANFRHGDVVNFLMFGSTETPNPDLNAVFNGDSSAGHLNVTGNVHFPKDYQQGDGQVTFQLLVDKDTSKWFDEKAPVKVPYANMPDDIKAYFTPELQLRVTDASNSPITVDNYYSVIKDVSGFDASYGYVLNPGHYPLDLRFFHGSRGFRTDTTPFASYYQLKTPASPNETLGVGLRDSRGLELKSTFADASAAGDVYVYRKEDSLALKVAIMVDSAQQGFTNDDTFRTGLKTAGLIANGLLDQTASLIAGFSRTGGTGIEVSLNSILPNGAIYVSKSFETITPNYSDPLTPGQRVSDQNDHPVPWLALNPLSAQIGLITAPEITARVIILGSNSSNPNDQRNRDIALCYYPKLKNTKIIVVAPPGSETDENILELANGAGNIIIYDKARLGTPLQPQLYKLDGTPVADEVIMRLRSVRHVGHNALAVHTADYLGHSQAGTAAVSNATFAGVALHYALADASGYQIDSTMNAKNRNLADSSANNALYVNLNVDTSGGVSSVSGNHPLYVSFPKTNYTTKPFDISLGNASLINPATNSDISSGRFNIDSLGISNETAVPVWVKVYDVSTGYVNRAGTRDKFADLSQNVILNIAVPGLSTRDFDLSYPIKVSNGLYFAASTNYKYDVSAFPPGNNAIYVQGSTSRLAKQT